METPIKGSSSTVSCKTITFVAITTHHCRDRPFRNEPLSWPFCDDNPGQPMRVASYTPWYRRARAEYQTKLSGKCGLPYRHLPSWELLWSFHPCLVKAPRYPIPTIARYLPCRCLSTLVWPPRPERRFNTSTILHVLVVYCGKEAQTQTHIRHKRSRKM